MRCLLPGPDRPILAVACGLKVENARARHSPTNCCPVAGNTSVTRVPLRVERALIEHSILGAPAGSSQARMR